MDTMDRSLLDTKTGDLYNNWTRLMNLSHIAPLEKKPNDQPFTEV